MVLQWFRALDPPPREIVNARGLILYFADIGPLADTQDGDVDSKNSPLVLIDPVAIRRGVLWTCGEVHFLASRTGAARQLDRVQRKFRAWLQSFDCVFNERAREPGPFDYWLEGSIRNFGSVWALPSALEELRRDRYFVANNATEFQLDALCKQLALRGVVTSS